MLANPAAAAHYAVLIAIGPHFTVSLNNGEWLKVLRAPEYAPRTRRLSRHIQATLPIDSPAV